MFIINHDSLDITETEIDVYEQYYDNSWWHHESA